MNNVVLTRFERKCNPFYFKWGRILTCMGRRCNRRHTGDGSVGKRIQSAHLLYQNKILVKP